MKIYWITFFFFTIILTLSNCSESNSNTSKPILFPNKDSELTLLMRDMYNYYDSLKTDIEQGAIPDSIRNFGEIHHARATQPSKSSSPLFKAMSTVYLQSAEQLHSSKSNLPKAFNHMVDDCMNCHKQMCPGPMVKIEKLYVKMTE